ncbi:MAG TPA: NHLP family bacteriocin export ABC transporter peptidase/permease/ATPase subunit [Lachnospiraceae bacterium]|nr:NHLP family bacteriocin export ABC transporter peptidase/permease/ATPase subunit [Lachnospiraceae bacterium]
MRGEGKKKPEPGRKKAKASAGYAKTPTVFQMEATECGAASLAMVLGYFGKFIPLEQMRIETGVSRDGCSAGNIVKAAKRLGLEANGYRKNVEGLLSLPVPCIIHWNFNHFVVWEGVKGNDYYINDPAMGRRKLTFEDIDSCFTGVVLTFRPAKGFIKNKKEDRLLPMILHRLRGEKASVISLIVMGMFLVLPGMLIPVFTEVFIDDILTDGSTDWITALMFAMFVTMVYKAGFMWYRSVLLQRLQNKLTLLSGHRMLHHLFRLPIGFFDQRYPGDISQRVENNNNISVFLTSRVAQTVLNILTALFFVILLLMYSPLLTLVGLGITALSLLLMKRSADVIGDLTMKSRIDSGKFTGTLMSGLTITDTLKASGSENVYVERLLGYYTKMGLAEQKLGFRRELMNAIPQVSGNLTDVLVLVIGGALVIRGDMTAGMLTAFTTLLASFMQPVNELAGFIQQLQSTKADLSRVDDIMRYREDEKFAEGEKEELTEKLIGNIRLENVAFGYSIMDEPLISNFSFTLHSGSSIAFVGASGCGKTTMSKICSGLYMPWEGRIIYDETPLERIPKEVLASSISTVSQNISLFSGTIRENLTMWNNYIPEEDIVKACKDACIHDMITAKPGAYEYMLSEGGSNLSGGQRQRLEIARALVTNPSILIMDEATSALDPVIEKQIIDNIKRRGCTCVIVAHRLSAIRDCDEIIVMEQGKITQRGTHEELSLQQGSYQRLIQNM